MKNEMANLEGVMDKINQSQVDTYEKFAGLKEKAENGNVDLDTNAIMYSSGSNAGQELVDNDEMADNILLNAQRYSTFLSQLPSFHGVNMPKKMSVPVLGKAPLFGRNSEKTSGAFAQVAGTTAPTDEVEISQGMFVLRIDVSRVVANYSKVDLENYIRQRLQQSAVRSIEAVIINGDAETGATGNVNKDDGAPAGTEYYLEIDHGLRELAINNSYTTSVGTLDGDDFVSVASQLGMRFANPKDCGWLFNVNTYWKAHALDKFVKADERGEKSVLAGNLMTTLMGAPVWINEDMGLTEADGKISATGGNNTKGQFIAFDRYSVQYGYGKPLEIMMYNYGAQGYQLEAWFDFGFVVHNTQGSETDPAVSAGINITV